MIVSTQPNTTRPKLLVCAGSARADSLHRQLAQAAQETLVAAGADASFVEIGHYDLPVYNQDLEDADGLPAHARELREMLLTHDGLALASPEYNGSYSPLLKNTIDWVSRPQPGEQHSQAFKGKVAGLMSTTPGPSGGGAGLQQLRELLQWLGMSVIDDQLTVGRSSQAFDGHAHLVRPGDIEAMKVWAQELVQAVKTPQSIPNR